MLHTNIQVKNNEEDWVGMVSRHEESEVRVIFRPQDARVLIDWGFKPCTVLDVEIYNIPYSFTMLEGGFLGVNFEQELMILDTEEVELLKVSLYTLLTSGTFATDCND